MPEAYSNSCQVSKMMSNIENPGIVRTVRLGILRRIQGHSAILRHIQALLRHIEPYSDIFRTLCNPSIYNRVIFRTLIPEASSKACRTCKITWHIQSLGIVGTLRKHFQGYLGIFI